MMTRVSTADARKNFAEIVNQVAYGKEPVILTRRGKAVAALVSMEEITLLQQIEERVDIEEAKRALAEPEDNIPAEKVWKQLGI